MARLKLRELLMPEVVSTVDMEGGAGKVQRVNKVGRGGRGEGAGREGSHPSEGVRVRFALHALLTSAARTVMGGPPPHTRHPHPPDPPPRLQIKSWAVNPGLFPSDLSPEAKALCAGEWSAVPSPPGMPGCLP